MKKRLLYRSPLLLLTTVGFVVFICLVLHFWSTALPPPIGSAVRWVFTLSTTWMGWGAYPLSAFLLLLGAAIILKVGPGVIPYLCFLGLGSLLLDLILYLLGKVTAGRIGTWLASEITSYIGSYGLFVLVCLFSVGLLFTVGFHKLIIYLSKGVAKAWQLTWGTKPLKRASLCTPKNGERGIPTLETIIPKKEDEVEVTPPTDIEAMDRDTAEEPVYIKETLVRPKKGKVGRYKLPPLDLLDYHPPIKDKINHTLLEKKALQLEDRLSNYGVLGKVVSIHHGPVVTMFEFQPAPGVKVSRIANLADDIAMAMKAMGVRIVAPIPGKDVVGIEIPNEQRETVYFREIVGSERFNKSPSPLTMALGKDIFGRSFVSDLKKMPHLLVAGATGSGKSIGLNTIISSILYKATPEVVKFIMVDPKMLEFSVYNGIPHLITPVITDPRKAASALSWAVSEMEKRYVMLTEVGVRNIQSYNKQAEERLPYIVILIDELADLMMIAAREVETLIARLAQKARAAGIHLVVATQRPSVDVITGLIKANFPSRISYKVSSKVDSRTILDTMGAEKLLGLGDMLFLPPGTSELIRLHGAYISDDEIYRIAEFWRTQGEPTFDEEVVARPIVEDGEGIGDLHDELYPQAVELVVRTGHASASMIQRYLKIGYNRAARLIERMETEGIVGPAQGSRPREVLRTPQELKEILQEGE